MAPFIFGPPQQDPHHQSREDDGDVSGGDEVRSPALLQQGQRSFSSGRSARPARSSARRPSAAARPYVDHRWLGGMLTNFKTVRQSIKRLKEMEAAIEGRQRRENAQERGPALSSARARQAAAQPGRHQGAGQPARRPVRDRPSATRRAPWPKRKSSAIPVIGVVDTNHNPDGIAYVIPWERRFQPCDPPVRARHRRCDHGGAQPRSCRKSSARRRTNSSTGRRWRKSNELGSSRQKGLGGPFF